MLLVQSKFRKDYLRSWFINSSDHSWLLGGTTQCLELSLCSKTSQTTHVANQNDKNVFSVTSHCPKNTLIVCINNCLVPKRKMKGNVLETTITNISFKFYKNNDIWINYIRQKPRYQQNKGQKPNHVNFSKKAITRQIKTITCILARSIFSSKYFLFGLY